MRSTNFFIFFILINTISVFSQTEISIQKRLEQASSDSSKINILLEFSKKLNFSNPNLSYDYAKQALELSEKSEYKIGKAEALRRIGVYYIYHNDFSKAMDFIFQSLNIAEEINNKQLISKCLMNIGSIYYDNKDYNQALVYFSKSLKIAKETNDKQDISNCLTNFGNMYSDMGDFKLALENYQNALNLYVEIQDKQGISKSLFNIGNVYFYQENYKAALDYYEKSLKINKEQNDKLDIIIALNNIGKVYLKIGKLEKALSYCTQSLDRAWQVNSQDDIQQACHVLATIYKKKKDYKTALGYYQLATSIKETLNNELRIKEFGKLEAKHQLEKQETEIKLLKKDNALKEEQSDKELLMKNIIIAGILMFSLIGVSVLLYNKNQKEHKINLQLVIRNREIAAQAEVLKTLNEELDNFVYRSSHDLKAPLTSVLGLVSIVQMDVFDAKTSDYLEKIKRSIDKLMLVLQDLTVYSKNSRLQIEIKKIDFKEIIENCILDLHYLEKIEQVNIDYKISEGDFYSDPTRLSILITNLLSNAIIHNNFFLSRPLININIEISKDNAIIAVQDSGKGIAKEIEDRIFDMFFKGSNESQGSGLGLYIAMGVIKKLKGKLYFETTENIGTVFTAEICNNKIIN